MLAIRIADYIASFLWFVSQIESHRMLIAPKKTVGLAILSWKSPLTIKSSLESYISNNFFSLFDDVVLCFQEIDDDDISLATKAGLRYVGNNSNTGIQGGFKMALESLNTDYIMILENDLHLIVDKNEAEKQLSDCLTMMEYGVADMARMRSRFNPGYPHRAASIYSKFYPISQQDPRWNDTEKLDRSPNWKKRIRRFFRPNKAHKWSGRSVYIESNPEQLFPDIISREGEYLIVDSSVMPWTNQPTLVSSKLLRELMDYAENNPSSRTVNGFQDFEKPLNCKFWRSQHYKIVITPGLFTHERLDR